VKPLETVIADGYEEAAVLRRNGLVAEADARVRMLKDIENATVDFRTFRTEDEAALRSGKSTAWFRARFPQWLAQNLARYNPLKPRLREYRSIVIPMKANVEAAREEARQAALATMEKAS
jgi:hypothetical protein